jgi:hypothetical protein
MVFAESNKEVAGGGLAPVTDGAPSDIASMPDISRKNVLGFLEGDSDLLMECLLCLVRGRPEGTFGALGAPGTAATGQFDIFDASKVLVTFPACCR